MRYVRRSAAQDEQYTLDRIVVFADILHPQTCIYLMEYVLNHRCNRFCYVADILHVERSDTDAAAVYAVHAELVAQAFHLCFVQA
jgi:hypothetical protein